VSRKSVLNRSLTTLRVVCFVMWSIVAVATHDSTVRIVAICIAALYGICVFAWIWTVPEKAFESDDQLERGAR
jgi:hypothetical protein